MKQPDLDRIYKDVPAEQKQMLLDFRASHPYKEMAIHGTAWRYLSCGQGEHALLFPEASTAALKGFLDELLSWEDLS